MSPKLVSEYTCKTSFFLECDTKQQLRALAYYWNMSGEISKSARHILEEGIKSTLKQMTQEELARFEQIMFNVEKTHGNTDLFLEPKETENE